MIFYTVYLLVMIVLVLHFIGFFGKYNIEWVPLLCPIAIFTVIILDYMKII